MNGAPKHSQNQPRDTFGSQLNHKKPPAKKSWPKFAGIIVIVLIAAAVFYFTQTKKGRETIAPITTVVTQNPNLIFEDANSDIVNILLIGRDVNYKIIFKHGKPIAHTYDEDTPARSDTMILLSLDKNRRTMRMISFPRDALVRMPPNDYHVRIAKLNAAHAYGGPEMLMQTFRDDFGITVHHYAEIRFDGFKSLIDKVGGIDVDVIGALHRDGSRGNLNYDDNWANLHIHLKPGMQHLNGEEAHNYVRFRMDLEGDPGRIRRQQQVLRALGKQLTHQPIIKIPGLVAQVRQSFKTDMSDSQIASAAFFAKSLGDASKIDPVTLFGVYTKRGSITLNRSKNIQLLSYVLGSTFNPGVFLENSPSTEGDELGMENDSSPGAKELLEAAGLLKSSSSNSSSEGHASHTSTRREHRSDDLSTPTKAPVKSPRRSPSRIAESSSSSDPAPPKAEPLSVDDTNSSVRSAAPIRQQTPVRREFSDTSPVPQPE